MIPKSIPQIDGGREVCRLLLGEGNFCHSDTGHMTHMQPAVPWPIIQLQRDQEKGRKMVEYVNEALQVRGEAL